MNRILAIARKELLHIVREPRTLIAVLVLPILELFLFAYALSFDVKNIPTAVLDQDKTVTSRSYVDSFHQSGYFDVDRHLESMSQIDDVFDASEDRAVVIIKPGFSDAVASGRRGQVAVLLDGSEPNAAQLGQTYAQGLSRFFGAKVTRERLLALGADPSRASPIEVSVRTWYNPEARSSVFLVPGLIVILIMIVTVQQTANTLVREKDAGTLEQLVVSPIRRIELVVGKLLPWAAIAGADVVGITLFGLVAFSIPFRGSLLVFALASALFVICALALGILISARASSVEVANQIALLLSFLPGFMLSGFVYPLNNIPVVLRFISYLFPARYFMTVTRSVFLKGAGMDVLWPQVGSLAIYAVVATVLSASLYRRRL